MRNLQNITSIEQKSEPRLSLGLDRLYHVKCDLRFYFLFFISAIFQYKEILSGLFLLCTII